MNYINIDLLKDIENVGVYKFKYPGGFSILLRELEYLVKIGFINEKDVSKGFWVFSSMEYEYTITHKGLEYVEQITVNNSGSESIGFVEDVESDFVGLESKLDFIDEICTNYRNDFRLLSKKKKEKIRAKCKKWIRAIDQYAENEW